MYTTESVMRDLEAAGTEQNRKIYRRHGAGDNQFGVSYANLGAMEKQIKREKNPNRDHLLGLELWATGNLDAQVLALRLADPTRVDDATLNQWAREVDNYGMADALGAFAARSANAHALGYAWIDADGEWIETAGWDILLQLIMNGTLTDAECEALLARIGRDIRTAKNRVRYAMNMTIINIGVRGGGLYTDAMNTARTIGPVIVDHGQTGCKTPDAAGYIDKTLAYQAGKLARKASG